MKSPTTKFGNIDPDGILYGSIKNDLNIKTNASIGKRDAKKSIKKLFRIHPLDTFEAKYSIPEIKVIKISKKVKSIVISLAS